jgi:hypothetical protein
MSSSTPRAVTGSPSSLDVRSQATRSSSFALVDQYGQPMPAGTKVTCTTTLGVILAPIIYTVPDSTGGAYNFSCTVKGTGPIPDNNQTCTSTTGTLRAEITTPRGLVSYLPGVTVTDNLKCDDNVVTPPPAAPTISTASLGNGVVGTPYTSTLLQATGGTSPYTWSAPTTGGNRLPPGLTLATNGVLSGTPTEAGIYPAEKIAGHFLDCHHLHRRMRRQRSIQPVQLCL